MFNFAETRELVLFSYLYSSLSLSEAAKKLGISESNASKILKSFRDKMDDPLFVRSNARMYPTDKAQTIYPAVQRIVATLTEIHNCSDEAFDPKHLTRTFHILATDMVSCYLLSVVSRIISEECPNASFEVHPLHEDYQDILSSRADLAIFTPIADLPKEFDSVNLYENRNVILLRKGHPLLKEARTPAQLKKALAEFRKIDLLFAFRSNHKEFSPYDTMLDKHGQTTVLSSPYIRSFPPALIHSDYTAPMPHFVADCIVKRFPELTYITSPQQKVPWTTKLIWNKRVNHDPAVTWFRSKLYAEIRKEVGEV